MRLYLVKNGVPYDVAFSLDYTDALGHMIVFGEFDGSTWNWEEMRFVQRT